MAKRNTSVDPALVAAIAAALQSAATVQAAPSTRNVKPRPFTAAIGSVTFVPEDAKGGRVRHSGQAVFTVDGTQYRAFLRAYPLVK